MHVLDNLFNYLFIIYSFPILIMLNQLRIEISFKDLEQLKKKIEFCLNNNVHKINIPCKGKIKKELLLDAINLIGVDYKSIDVIYHYSFYHEFYRNNKLSYDKFLNFVEVNKTYKNNQILLVSGSKKRNNFEVLTILNDLKSYLINEFKFGVAYNPYFEEGNDIENERNRLIGKLNSGLIKSIWLQFGSELNNLKREINFMQEIKKKFFEDKKNNIELYGSIFIPSKQSLARFKFRPWPGVFLSNEYLNSIEKSTLITKKIINLYLKSNIIPLIESECSSEKQFAEVRKFIKL